MGKKRTAEDIIINKLQRPEKIVAGNLESFNSFFEKERSVNRKGNLSKRGRQFLKTTNEFVEYESALESKILKLLDESEQIVGIKTQALSLEYYYRGQDRFYYPDVVIMSSNGHIGVIEIKDTISMFKVKTIKKYEALQQYCNENGFFYAMLNDRDDVETIKNAEINSELEDYLLRLFSVRDNISWASIKDTCKNSGWVVQEVLTIAYKNNWKIQSPKSRVWAFNIKK